MMKFRLFKQNRYYYCLLPVYHHSFLSGGSQRTYPDDSTTIAPDSICTAEAPGYIHTSVGYAEKSLAGASFMKQMAAANARSSLATTQQDKFKEIIRSEDNATSSYISHQELTQVKIIHTPTSPNGWLFMLIGMPADH